MSSNIIVAGHQPNYLPYPGFFHKMVLCDVFVIVDNVQFVKRGPFGWIHRNRIQGNNGYLWLTVPVKTKGKFFQKIKEVEIDNSKNWRQSHFKSIKWNYSKKSFFEKYSGEFEKIYAKDWNKLLDLNLAVIRLIMELLHIKKEIYLASDLGIEGKGSELVLNICKKFSSRRYLSGIHGRDYLDKNLFEKNGIEILFQELKEPQNPEGTTEVPNFELSIIDLLFKFGERSLEVLMSGGGTYNTRWII